VADETIAAAFHAAGVDGAADIQRVWKSRFSALPENNRERARQVRFLQGRGFGLDDILKFLRARP
jgi:regulatory protein